MTRLTMVGGPRHGETVEISRPTNVIRIAVPVSVRDWTLASTDPTPTVDYNVYGNEARWEGMIGDARVLLQATAEVMADRRVNYKMRAVLRDKTALAFERLSEGKEVDRRKIWRVDYDPEQGMLIFTAFVGPRRVTMGLLHRQDRRDGVPRNAR